MLILSPSRSFCLVRVNGYPKARYPVSSKDEREEKNPLNSVL